MDKDRRVGRPRQRDGRACKQRQVEVTGGGQVERDRQVNRQTEDRDRQAVDRDPASGLKTGNEKDTTMQTGAA